MENFINSSPYFCLYMWRRQRLFGVKNQMKGLTDKTRAEKMEVGRVNHIFENTGSGLWREMNL